MNSIVKIKNGMNTFNESELKIYEYIKYEYMNYINYIKYDIFDKYKKDICIILLLTYFLYFFLYKNVFKCNKNNLNRVNMSYKNMVNDFEIQNKILKEENKEFVRRNDLMKKMLSTTSERFSTSLRSIIPEYDLKMFDLNSEIKKLKDRIIDLSKVSDDQFMENIEIHDKLNKIRDIFVSEEYNDPEYLLYDEWNITKLKDKARQLKITLLSTYRVNSRRSLAYAIRLTEQRNRIEEIVEPVYPDGYETEEMVLKDSDNDESECE